MTSFVFYIIAIILVAAAVGVMVMRDVFRAGLFLIFLSSSQRGFSFLCRFKYCK